MSCPDLRTLGRVGTDNADPSILEHIASCRSCWLDWQIQQGARYLEDPATRGATEDLDDRVVARMLLRSRHLELPAGWAHSAISGTLVAIATLACLLGFPAASVVIPVGPAVAYSVGAGVLGMFYVKERDERRSRRWPGVAPDNRLDHTEVGSSS